MKFRWSTATPQPLLARQLAEQLQINPLLAQCLLNRGLSEPSSILDFLSPRLKHLGDPFALPNMAAAVDRLFRARSERTRLVVFGDYDVDGVTATTILFEVLEHFGWRVETYLPNRMEEGYGLSRDGVENCLNGINGNPLDAKDADRIELLLAVDCGSTAAATIDWLNGCGVDVIILDHHQISNPPPDAVALVNPQLRVKDPGANQEFNGFCSAGLAFKLAHALLKRAREQRLPGATEYDLRPLLDLVALGTIADLVPLTGENRILTAAGLERLNVTRRPGLVALKKVSQSPEKLGTFDVGFQLAPRLNAAGRLETAEESLRLLLARDLEGAMPLAQNLDSRNRERQRIEKGIVEQVLGLVRSKFNPQKDFVIVEGQLLWHIGVVGIVASRVLQEFYRPTIIIGGENGEMRGSGRSIAGFDLAMALRECDGILLRHGGHAMAAGLSILPDKIDLFRDKLNEVARRCLKLEDMRPALRLDAEVDLSEITLDSLAEMEKLKPTGQGNAEVQFFARNLAQARPLLRMGKDQQHLKLWVTDGRVTHEAVWWKADKQNIPNGRFDLAFAPGVNEFNGKCTVQLKVLDWRSTGCP